MSTAGRSGRSVATTTQAGRLPMQEATSPSPLADRARTGWPPASSAAATCSPKSGSLQQRAMVKSCALRVRRGHSTHERAVVGGTFAVRRSLRALPVGGRQRRSAFERDSFGRRHLCADLRASARHREQRHIRLSSLGVSCGRPLRRAVVRRGCACPARPFTVRGVPRRTAPSATGSSRPARATSWRRRGSRS